MNKADAIRDLRSTDEHSRLRAARYFQVRATTDDVPVLRAVLQKEVVSWVRRALADAMVVASGEADDDAEVWSGRGETKDESYRQALGEATRSLVHEIQPLIGQLKLAAMREVPNYDSSDTLRRINRLSELVEAINRLRQATAAPTMQEFDVDEWIRDVVGEELGDLAGAADLVGKQHLVVVGDPRLLRFALCNSLRNAVEATSGTSEAQDPPNILVSWGETDIDYWVSVSDRGHGPPPGKVHAFRQGSTTKDGHLGMGLAIADAAMASLSGSISLHARKNLSGATLEFRWPKALPVG